MPTEAELFAHVKESIGTALGAEVDTLSPETRLFEDLGVDSVDLLDITYEIERLTGCELEVSDLFGGDEKGTPQPGRELSLGDLVRLLKAKIP